MSLTPSARFVILTSFAGGWLTCVDGAEIASTTAFTTPAQLSSPTANELAPSDVARAKRWGLSPVEWQRYGSLMTGIRGSVSPPTLSPIEVLGIHARTEVERRQYAEQWARLMHDDVERVLAFQRAYDEALRRLFGDEPLISAIGSADHPQGALGKADRLLLFVMADCETCDGVVKDVLRLQPRVAGIDLYLAGLNPEAPAAAQAWAKRHEISVALVKRGEITLNFEGGTLAQLGQSLATLPLVMRRRENEVTVLDLGALR